eukprot:7741858-Pyramimonas_sp.AAC.1
MWWFVRSFVPPLLPSRLPRPAAAPPRPASRGLAGLLQASPGPRLVAPSASLPGPVPAGRPT